jgi:hypothetical protein
MNKIAIATRADNNNLKYYEMFKNSLRKFHKEDEVDLLLWDEEKIKTYNDEIFFYRASPTIAKEIIDKYELILMMDCDQIIMGRLDHLFNRDYDIGTVLNINRVDPPIYGMLNFMGGQPNEYYNNGLVAIRNNEKGRDFIHQWDRLCHSKYFHRLQYREQDVLNILAHYGDYNVLCFDDYDAPNNIYTWNGIVAKGETIRANMIGYDVVIPVGEDRYPDHEIILKIIHWGGGKDTNKMNYRTCFQEPAIEYIDWLVSNSQEPYHG